MRSLRSHGRAVQAAHRETWRPFETLPPALFRKILLDLPVDARARAAAVCREWRAVLTDYELWQILDFFELDTLLHERVTPEAVLAAAARADGQLIVLNVAFNNGLGRAVEDIVLANAASLCEVDVSYTDTETDVFPRLLAAAPDLEDLRADVLGFAAELIPMLRNEPPYQVLRVRSARLGLGLLSDEEALDVAAALAAHEPLEEVCFFDFTAAALESEVVCALLEATVTRRVYSLELDDFFLSSAVMPPLTRLLQCGSLTILHITCEPNEPLDEDALAQLAAALAGSPMLYEVELKMRLFEFDNYGAVLDAFRRMPALVCLDLRRNKAPAAVRDAVGRALGALLADDAEKLRHLNVELCGLGDRGLAPLLDGMEKNTHLKTLYSCRNEASRAFHRRRLTPLQAADARVKANALDTDNDDNDFL